MTTPKEFLTEMGLTPNEHGVFLFRSGNQEINLSTFLEMYLEEVFEKTLKEIQSK